MHTTYVSTWTEQGLMWAVAQCETCGILTDPALYDEAEMRLRRCSFEHWADHHVDGKADPA